MRSTSLSSCFYFLIKTAAKDEPVILLEIANRLGEPEKIPAKQAKGGIDLQNTCGTAGLNRSTFSVFKTDIDTKALRLTKKQTLATSSKRKGLFARQVDSATMGSIK
jgi:hypothetical protein